MYNILNKVCRNYNEILEHVTATAKKYLQMFLTLLSVNLKGSITDKYYAVRMEHSSKKDEGHDKRIYD